ncbi:helix-turn-helix transcriptional regulator [Termitidicoccus mucosus]|uniref:HTH luxR-type domain-containing protein n=1 Tax=Termitidicoccus mucosus TaxID=1184151 RepID=A0A178IF59_9BACT|nr:hypothetical protein AW736_20640 [Opitutaceae bacterium TSB47]
MPPTPDTSSVLHDPKLQRALLDLHGALEFHDLWGSLQHLFEVAVPHDTLVMSANYLDWRRESSTRRRASRRSRIADPEFNGRAVVEHGAPFFQPFLDAHKGIPCYSHSDIIADARRITRLPYYRKYMQPAGWRYSAHLLFWRDGAVDTSFALRRRPDQGDFLPGEMDLLRAVHPHIEVAFERMRKFEHERQRRRLLETFYRATPEALLFLDWNLKCVYSSRDALSLCAHWNLGPGPAKKFSPQAIFDIPPAIAAACEEIRAEWLQAAPAHPSSPAPASSRRAGAAPSEPAGDPPLRHLVDARSGCEALVSLRKDTANALTKPVFIIRLRPPGGAAGVDGSETAAPAAGSPARLLHALSPTERELVMLVCAGCSNKEIAMRTAKTEGSVKVLLSRIFKKLHVTSRTRLIIALQQT